MKNKLIYLILSIALIASVALNIYEFKSIKSSDAELASMQEKISRKTSEYEKLQNEIKALQEDIASTQQSFDDKQAENDALVSENDVLNATVADLEAQLKEKGEASSVVSNETAKAEVSKQETASSSQSSVPAGFDPQLYNETVQKIQEAGGFQDIPINSTDYSNAAPADGTHYGDAR